MALLVFLVCLLVVVLLALMPLWLGELYHEFVCGELGGNKIMNTKDAWRIIAEKVPKQIRGVENQWQLNITLRHKLPAPGVFYNSFPVKEISLGVGMRPWILLHEYGHFIDWSWGRSSRLSNLEEWQSIFLKAKSAKSLIFYNKIHFNLGSHHLKSSEFFAECFMLFYLSRRSRERLKKLFPEAYRYFRNIESQSSEFAQPLLFERLFRSAFGITI